MMQPGTCRRSGGFSLIELLVALTITLLMTLSVATMLSPATGAFQVQPESADLDQRLRAAVDALERDLLGAGSGPAGGPYAGAFGRVVPAILPQRVGLRNPDDVGTFQSRRITILTLVAGAAEAMLASPLPAMSGTAQIAAGPSCPAADRACGFRSGMVLAAFDGSGAWDLYSVTAVAGSLLTLRHLTPDSPKTYAAEQGMVAQVSSRTYMLVDDRGVVGPQLVQYEAGLGADVPVASHIVSLRFEYLGEAQPPIVFPEWDGLRVRTSYGPAPPTPGLRPTAYPAGENCAFARDADDALVSRLAPLASGPVLVPLDAARFTDGPWCPDEASPSRYDADLLRIRRVTVVVRAQAASASLRGPAGRLFTRGGTARGAALVPDREVRISVTPRALNVVR